MTAKEEVIAALEAALRLHAKDHALDHFDWGGSFLQAQDIQELNELPLTLKRALKRAKEL